MPILEYLPLIYNKLWFSEYYLDKYLGKFVILLAAVHVLCVVCIVEMFGNGIHQPIRNIKTLS